MFLTFLTGCGVILLIIAIVVGIIALVIFAFVSAGKAIQKEGIKFEAKGTDKDGKPVSVKINFDSSLMFATTSTTTEAPITDLITGRFENDRFNRDSGRFTSSRNNLNSLPYKIAQSEDKIIIKRNGENSFTMTIFPPFGYQSHSIEKEISFTSGKVFKLSRINDPHNTVNVTIDVGESSWSEKHVGYQTVNIKREFTKESMKTTYTQNDLSYEKIFQRKKG